MFLVWIFVTVFIFINSAYAASMIWGVWGSVLVLNFIALFACFLNLKLEIEKVSAIETK